MKLSFLFFICSLFILCTLVVQVLIFTVLLNNIEKQNLWLKVEKEKEEEEEEQYQGKEEKKEEEENLTRDQQIILNQLFQNQQFLKFWQLLKEKVTIHFKPGLIEQGIERFGLTLKNNQIEINPTKKEHLENPLELADTIIHELVHVYSNLYLQKQKQKQKQKQNPEFALFQNPNPPKRKNTIEDLYWTKKLGPGASNPCGEYLDISSEAQDFIVSILKTIRKETSVVTKPTKTFINVEIRNNTLALEQYIKERLDFCGY